ncbi:MAG: hypothetical protein WCO09_02625 [bacterium]
MSKTRLFYVSISLLIISVLLIGYFYKNRLLPQQTKYKCPETYSEDSTGTVEYRKAIADWTLEFFKENPKATMSDWSIAKGQLWIDNNCTIAIQRSKLSGKVSDLKTWELIDYQIQSALDKVAY